VALPPSLTAQPVSQTALPGTNVAFGMTVSGVGPFTYQWQFNGSNLPNGIITTVAGNGTAACAGDGGAATSASLNNPQCVAFDNFGNLFIADTANSRIRKVSPNGIISTVAGTNSGGYSGDGGMATNAQLSSPCGIVLDAAGNLYIADSANNRIRKVAPMASLLPRREPTAQGFRGMAGRPPTPNYMIPLLWPWTLPATFILLTTTTGASARWMPMGLFPPSLVTA